MKLKDHLIVISQITICVIAGIHQLLCQLLDCVQIMGFKYFSANSSVVVPDIHKFNILRLLEIDDFTIVEIHYTTCHNFGGHKILVFKDLEEGEITKVTEIDPHFYPKSKLIARFLPTEEGWDMAVDFCTLMKGRQ